MKVTYYGHSCFLAEVNSKKLLFDPFITANELAKHINIVDIEADYIFLSHAHEDHIADAEAIARSTGAVIVSNYEIAMWFAAKGITSYHPMNTGGKWTFNFGTVKCVHAVHSSSFPDGTYGGNPMGFIISSPEGSFYYSGDTALTLDMQLIPGWAKLNFAVLPVGDNFTMGYEDAVEAARMIDCKEVIGVHFDTFGLIRIDHAKAVAAFDNKGYRLTLPSIGETISIS